MPILSIHRDLHYRIGVRCHRNRWHGPGPGIDVKFVLRNLLSRSQYIFASWFNDSGPESVGKMWSLELESVTLMSLWSTSVSWSAVWVVKRCVRWHIVVKCSFFRRIAHSGLLGELLRIMTDSNSCSAWNGRFWRSELQGLVGNGNWMNLKNAKSDDCFAGGLGVKSCTVKSDQSVANSWPKRWVYALDHWINVVVESCAAVTHLVTTVKRNGDVNPRVISIDCITLLVQ